MRNLFSEKEGQGFIAEYPTISPELALRVYTSRLIGKDPNLVLHGGGNTSVKLEMTNIVGEEREVLYVKGSGRDLGFIEPSAFVGLELAPLRKLRRLSQLADDEMENQLQIHKVAFSSPDPSVEALLHAFLPARYVDQTHADPILVLTNQPDRDKLLEEALGEKAGILPYLTPGMPLAQGVSERYERNPWIEAIVVAHHGIFTFGPDAKTSYERMIEYVSRAEAFIEERTGRKIFGAPRPAFSSAGDLASAVARFNQVLRGVCSFRRSDGRLRRFFVEARNAQELIEASLGPGAGELCRSGVLTPDHVTRTKNLWAYVEGIPEEDSILRQRVKEAVDSYREDYDRYFADHAQSRKFKPEKLDSFPRIFLVAGAGIFALGYTRTAARVAADIAEHTLRAKLKAKAIGTYAPIAASHIFDMEYWPLQQKKVRGPSSLPLEGQAAVVTGSGGAIGLGVADRLLAAGAAVAISDIDSNHLEKVQVILTRKYDATLVEKIIFDVTDYGAVEKAFEEIARRLGGIDLLVPNAGLAHVAKVEDLEPEKFDRVIAVNLKGTFNVIKASAPIFRRQGTGGNIVVISSKNVFDPGAAFGAYSASNAGAHQISKIAALELAEYGVRVNLVNPDAVFGDEEVPSGLWELVGPARMKSRGLDPKGLQEYYRQRNLLKARVTAQHVGNAVVFFASEGTPTTGATLPVDGGIPAAFPR